MLDRRGFLKFIGGAAAGTLATPVIWKGLDDISIWTQNWPWIPRLEPGNRQTTYVRTLSKICPSAAGIRVRLVDGRPVRVLGDAEHPLSRGGVSSLAATEVQLRYSPARLRRPLRRAPDGGFIPISWEEAESTLARECANARGAEGSLWVSGDENGTMNELFAAFAAALGSERFCLMPGEAQPTAAAWALMGGRGRLGYDFTRSDHILAVGAEVLESWGPVVANRRAWGEARPLDKAPAKTLTFAGPVQGGTAAGADLWLPVRPGSEFALLLGLGNLVVKAGRAHRLPGLEGVLPLLAQWTPERVLAATGLGKDRLDAALKALLEAKAPLVIAGSPLGQGTSPSLILAAVVLNILLGNLNRDGGLRVLPTAPPLLNGAPDYATLMTRDLTAHTASVAAGRVAASRLLVFYEANPVYALPGGVDALFKKAAFSVAFSCFLDETAQRCDLVIPSALGLERHDDVAYPFGVGEFVYGLARPVAEPLFDSRPAGEVVLRTAARLGIPLGPTDVPALLRAKGESLGLDWERLCSGELFVSRITEAAPGLSGPWLNVLGQASQAAAKEVARDAAAQKEGKPTLAVAPVYRLALGTPETAIPPFNTKTISAGELKNRTLVARMNAATAKRFGLREGGRLRLANEVGEVRAVVALYEGVADGAVALTAGFGHTDFDVFNAGKGMNIMRLFTATVERSTGFAVWVCPGVTADNNA